MTTMYRLLLVLELLLLQSSLARVGDRPSAAPSTTPEPSLVPTTTVPPSPIISDEPSVVITPAPSPSVPTSSPLTIPPFLLPPSSPTTPEPTFPNFGCDAELGNLVTCFAQLPPEQASECGACINQVTPVTTEDCATTCQELATCDCGQCQPVAEIYVLCIANEFVGCDIQSCGSELLPSSEPEAGELPSDVPTVFFTDEPTVTSASGATTDPCAFRLTKMVDCLEIELKNGGRQCTNCLASQEILTDTCSDQVETVCNALDACDCGSCQKRVERYYSCLVEDNQCGVLDCDASGSADAASTPVESVEATSSMDICLYKQAAVRYCYEETNSGECDACMSTALSEGFYDSCTDLQAGLCAALNTCPCSQCKEHLNVYLDCIFENSIECNIDCSM